MPRPECGDGPLMTRVQINHEFAERAPIAYHSMVRAVPCMFQPALEMECSRVRAACNVEDAMRSWLYPGMKSRVRILEDEMHSWQSLR
jgi:hypothetical protein